MRLSLSFIKICSATVHTITSHRIDDVQQTGGCWSWCTLLLWGLGFFCSFLYSLNRFDVAVRLHCRLCGHILFLSLLYQLSSLCCFVGMWWHCGCLCCCCGLLTSFFSSIFTLTKPIGCSAFINDINGGKIANKIYCIDDCKLLLHSTFSITNEPCWTLTLSLSLTARWVISIHPQKIEFWNATLETCV